MTQQRPGQNQQQYGYPPQSVVDWCFVVNSGQYVDLTSPVPAPGQQWIHGQPHAARGTGSASHTVVAPQMMQNLPHRYGLFQAALQIEHSPVIDLDTEQGGKSDQECNSMSSDTGESSPQQVHHSSKCLEYSVKVVPPDRKAGYQIHKLRAYTRKKFVNVEELKSQLQKSLDEHVSNESAMNFGYIEPSKQGVRGKMRWTFTADDLKDMYAAYEQKTQTEVLIWCDGRKVVKEDDVPRPKRAHVATENSTKKSSVAVSQDKKLSEVQEIYEKLKSTHTGYDQERLRMWAHLIQMGKHESYEVPPNQPFFKDAKSRKKDETTKGPAAQNPAETCISPVKRSNLHSAYMSQVKEWHGLFKDGAITEEEYEHQKEKILGDLGKL